MLPATPIAEELMAGARYLGGSLLLSQGAGANNSAKDVGSDSLWIKASGITLSQVEDTRGFVNLALSQACSILHDPALTAMLAKNAQEEAVRRFAAAIRSENGLRPSMETGMHAALSQRAILHSHSVSINAFACMQNGRDAAARILPKHQWIPYATPGYELALAVRNTAAREPGRDSAALILENHGFVAAASSTAKAVEISEEFVASARGFFGPIDSLWLTRETPQAPMLKLVEQAEQQARSSDSTRSFRAGQFAIFRSRTDLRSQAALTPLVPDDVVYLGPQIWRATSLREASSALQRLQARGSRFALVVPETGILFGADNEGFLAAMEEVMLAHLLIALLVASKGVLNPLSEKRVGEIMEMESEQYRQRLAGRSHVETVGCKS